MNPIHPNRLRDCAGIRHSFLSDHPLPRFAVIPNFLRPELVDAAIAGCREAEFDTFCLSAANEDGSDRRAEYREPGGSGYYISIHKKPRLGIPAIGRLKELFQTDEAIAALDAMTGAGVTRMFEPDVLTYWNPGSFLERHTDEIRNVDLKLVLSISLTECWDRAHGGSTVYAWTALDRAVRVAPTMNTAVLFVPFEGSEHWVEQISNDAPELMRFTWTASFV